ncbi:MAG TPA: hypothetical protein PLK19_16725 [Mycobacterium sp.]|nr:hypothetical protein [Mycobacterium sp.]
MAQQAFALKQIGTRIGVSISVVALAAMGALTACDGIGRDGRDGRDGTKDAPPRSSTAVSPTEKNLNPRDANSFTPTATVTTTTPPNNNNRQTPSHRPGPGGHPVHPAGPGGGGPGGGGPGGGGPGH